jgi:hypothetical protein
MIRFRSSAVALAALMAVVGACGGDGTGPDGPAPTVSGVSPAVGTVGTEVRIVGTNFRSGATVLLGTLVVSSVDVAGATEVFAFVPPGVAVGVTYDVTVRNADGTEFTVPAAFTAVSPILDFVNSATKPSGNTGSTVIIEGNAFGDLQGTGQMLFSDGLGGTLAAAIAAPEDWTNSFIVTTVPAGTASGPVLVETATGQSNTLDFTVTQNAIFSPSTISWSQTQDLPTAVSGHRAIFAPIDDAAAQTIQYVYTIGGASGDDVPRVEVDFAVTQNDGALSGWTQGTDLPAGRAFHAVVAATPFNSKVQGSGFLYILGGIEQAGGQPVDGVFALPLNDDGTTGAPVSATSLPVPLHSLGAVVFRSAIYVVGGATTDHVPVASVYRARIDTLGVLSAWETLPPLPSARAYHQVSAFGGFLYAVGGETGVVTPHDGGFQNNTTKLDEVAFAGIDLRTGDLATSSWTINGAKLGKSRSKHSSLAAGGNIFASAGLYAAAGTGSSENTFAQINADGTVGSFGGATGSNTLLSLGGVNLFNHAAIAYVDAAGVAHVMILGGDDVNAPGSKQSAVFFY